MILSRSVSPILAAIAVALLLAVSPLAAAQRAHSATQTFAAPDGTTLIIDTASVDVRMRTADVDTVEVATELKISGVGEEKAERYIASHTPATTIEDGRIVVTVRPGKSGFLGLGTLTARARLGFLVPGHIAPDITTTSGSVSIRGDLHNARPLYLRTATGDLELVGAAASVDLRSASGDTRIELIRPLERFFARTSSGQVNLTGGAREVHVDTASGNVWMANLSGATEVITSSGRVTLSWDRLDNADRVVVRSDSGRIRLTIPEGVSPRGSLRSIGGVIRSDFPGIVNEAGDAVALTGDGPEILAESASGDIVLEAGTWWGSESAPAAR